MGIFWPGKPSKDPAKVVTLGIEYPPEALAAFWRDVPNMHEVFAAGHALREGADIETARGLGELAAKETRLWLETEKRELF